MAGPDASGGGRRPSAVSSLQPPASGLRRTWYLRLRRYVQVASLLVVNSSFLVGLGARGVCVPVLNCWACPAASFACPLGALQNAVADARAVFVLPLYILGSLLAVSGIFGRMMCGWLCPFGLLQDLLAKLSRRKYTIPGWMSYTRYAVLVGLVLIVPYFTGIPWFCKLCPQGALEGGIFQPLLHAELRPLIGAWWYAKMGILAAVLAGAVFSRRAFCRVICPLGAIFSLFNRVSLFRMRYDSKKCTDCGWCVRHCPQGIDPRRDLGGHTCIGCLECAKCPFDAISVTTALSPDRGAEGADHAGEGTDT